jgi:hypothetical protein
LLSHVDRRIQRDEEDSKYVDPHMDALAHPRFEKRSLRVFSKDLPAGVSADEQCGGEGGNRSIKSIRKRDWRYEQNLSQNCCDDEER